MSNVEVKTLFDENRYPSGWKALFLILYTPVGLLLATIRFLFALHVLLAASLLPQLPAVKSVILRCMCVVLGLVVKQESITGRDENLKVLVANHISPCDHVAVHLVAGSVTPSAWDLPASLGWVLGMKDLGLRQGKDSLVANIRSHFEKSTAPLLCFPEGTTTSGKVGLLKFSQWPFSLMDAIQPVTVKIWRPPIADVAASALATGIWGDIFWFLFVPFTVFSIKFLPSMAKEERESDSQIADRTAKVIASDLGIATTQHTASDKTEYEKRYLLEQNQPIAVRPTSSTELQRMARQVGEVLPYVPHNVIVRDLARTRSVDVTIANILEGVVTYTPQPVESTPLPSTSSVPETVNIPSTSTSAPSTSSSTTNLCLDTSAPSFPRSAQERMLSFNERKARLIESARQRYIEKHGLKNVGLNC
ncbi:hypothetical protein L9F63_010796 [Diploptera punctata]|uniref:Lipid droplet-regulating VLDL assembly factor AUP1 n=1 Tax=Diploptera punctata TaxID=6984 RepID=A0AAD8EPN2_DIPPU|nr:hypothetical protein L9F63_010796 [Diploptera punctata]